MMIKKIKKLLFVSNEQLEEKIKETNNPYLKARLEWNYLFGDILKSKYQWQWTAMISLLANILLIFGFILLATQSKYVPYVIKVDKLGNSLYGGFIDKEKTISPLEINAFLRQYIINARSVIADAFAEKRAIDFVYAVSLPATRKHLDDFYQEANPFVLGKQALVEVEITGVVQKSSKTWQVDWQEVHRGLEGEVIKETHFEALITIAHMVVKNHELLNSNPLGIYIQHISWSQQNR